MLFAVFIQKLHSCVEPYKGRGAFTEKIIKLIVTDEKKLEHRSMESFNRYYDGKIEGKGKDKKIIRDMINAYAINIVQFLDESEDKTKSLPKFKAYLKDFRFNTAVQNKICDSFRYELPNINIDNYIDELAELLIQIIRKAANSKSRAVPNPGIDSVEVSVDNIRCNNKSSHRPDSNDEIELVEALAEPLNQMFSTPIEIADRQNINYSYSISLDEEKDIRNICKAIINNLDGLKRNVERVNSYKSELVKSPDSESNDMNEYYESHIKSKEKEFNKIYPVFVLQCAALNSKLAPKMYMNKSFAKLISITSFFISDENKEMSIDRFAETHVQVKVYDLQTYIKYSLKEIDMQ